MADSSGRETSLGESIQRIERAANRVLTALVIALVCASTMLACLSVVLRYGFASSFDLVEELCRYSIVYAVMLSFGPLITRNAHLSMSLLTDHMSPATQRYFDLVMHALLTAVLAFLFAGAFQWEASLHDMDLKTMSGVMSAWMPSAALPAGLLIATVYSALRTFYRFAGIPIGVTGAKE